MYTSKYFTVFEVDTMGMNIQPGEVQQAHKQKQVRGR